MALFDRRFKDYRFSEVTNEKGKRTVILNYVGNYFYFQDKERAMRAKPLLIAYAAVMIVCWFTALALKISALTVPYIIVPYVASAFGVLYVGKAAYVLLAKKEPFIRPDGAILNSRLPLGAGLCFLLVTASFVGTIVGMALGIDTWWGVLVPDVYNIVFLGICLMYIASAALTFRLRKALSLLEKVREPEPEPPKSEAQRLAEEKRAKAREADRKQADEVRQKNRDKEEAIKEELREKNTAQDAAFRELSEDKD